MNCNNTTVFQECLGRATGKRLLRSLDLKMPWLWRRNVDVEEYRANMRKYDNEWFKAKYSRSQLGFVIKAMGGLPGMFFFILIY